jgi:hypothetical protein
MATLSLYNHTAKILVDGSSTDVYRVILLSAGTFSATHTTLAAASAAYTQVANGNGYTTGGLALANVTVSTVTTNDAKFDADDAIWNATGSGITAVAAILYNDTLANDPPIAYINFGGSETANGLTDFKIVWAPSGIFTWTVA